MRGPVVVTVLLLAACTGPQPVEPPRQVVELAGRVPAGPPVNCVSAIDRQQLRLSESDRSTLVYGSGKTIWVNHLGPGCSFSWNDIPVFEVTGASYCRGDIVNSIDQSSHIRGPACALGDFLPYTRP